MSSDVPRRTPHAPPAPDRNGKACALLPGSPCGPCRRQARARRRPVRAPTPGIWKDRTNSSRSLRNSASIDDFREPNLNGRRDLRNGRRVLRSGRQACRRNGRHHPPVLRTIPHIREVAFGFAAIEPHARWRADDRAAFRRPATLPAPRSSDDDTMRRRDNNPSHRRNSPMNLPTAADRHRAAAARAEDPANRLRSLSRRDRSPQVCRSSTRAVAAAGYSSHLLLRRQAGRACRAAAEAHRDKDTDRARHRIDDHRAVVVAAVVVPPCDPPSPWCTVMAAMPSAMIAPIGRRRIRQSRRCARHKQDEGQNNAHFFVFREGPPRRQPEYPLVTEFMAPTHRQSEGRRACSVIICSRRSTGLA